MLKSFLQSGSHICTWYWKDHSFDYMDLCQQSDYLVTLDMHVSFICPSRFTLHTLLHSVLYMGRGVSTASSPCGRPCWCPAQNLQTSPSSVLCRLPTATVSASLCLRAFPRTTQGQSAGLAFYTYPGINSHPQEQLSTKDFRGINAPTPSPFGGVL